jgi:hypothetical protein
MVAARRGEIAELHQTVRLRLDGAQNFRERDAVRVGGLWIPPEIAYGLQMDASDIRGAPKPEPDNLADVMIVDAGDDRWDERHAEPVFGARRDRGFFLREKRPAPKPFVDRVLRAVELQEDEGQPRVGESSSYSAVLAEAKTVRV